MIDCSATIGGVTLAHPVMTASGTAGHSDELAAFVDLSTVGAVVVKSMASFAWQGNPSPRIHAVDGGMINAVGLQGRGTSDWIANDLPRLERRGARIVASIWGFRQDDYEAATQDLAVICDRLTAIEVNLSCPNLDHARSMFAHDVQQAAEVVTRVRRSLPRECAVWVKLSPNTDRIVAVADSVVAAGADALVLVNTVLGMRIDTSERRAVLGNGGGGLSGGAIHAVAVRSVFDVRSALPSVPIVGVGGVSRAEHAIELMMAGANAVQVGTATFADPRAIVKVQRGMERWAVRRGVRSWGEIVGVAH